MTGDAAKAECRETAQARRKAAHAAGAEAASAAASARLLALPSLGTARVVSGYLPIRSEIDPRPAMAALVARGLRVAVPVIEGKGLPLRFREWHPGAALVPGPFGAAVPEGGDWLVPDTLIVPLLAFDRGLWRLGYGGGFYDRTLAGLRAGGEALAIGLAYAAQEIDAVPRGPHDVRLDALVTEAESLPG